MAQLTLEESKKVGELRKVLEGEEARGYAELPLVVALKEALHIIDSVEEREWTLGT
jgi:hypothetical protein